MRNFIGKVVSAKTPKTVVVEIKSQRPHPIYKKIISKSKRIKAHYEGINVSEGDTVLISETRPISKTKHFKVIKLIK